jgi:hypothetical protein
MYILMPGKEKGLPQRQTFFCLSGSDRAGKKARRDGIEKRVFRILAAVLASIGYIILLVYLSGSFISILSGLPGSFRTRILLGLSDRTGIRITAGLFLASGRLLRRARRGSGRTGSC